VHIFLSTGSEQLRAQTLTLENEFLYIEFQQSLPAVDHYVLKSNNQVIYGYIAYPRYWSQIFHEGSLRYPDTNVDSITKGSDSICYHMRGELDSQQVVTFDLCYTLSRNSVELSFGNVQEIPGYKLVVVRPPDLLTVRADQGGAKLVFPYAEGRLIDVATTTSGDFNDAMTGGWTHAMLFGMLYHQGALAICSYDNLDMILEESVFDDPDQDRVGVIATHFYYRLPPNDFELASLVDVFDEQTTSLSAKLTFLADYDQDGDIDWMDGAKFLRDQVQAVPEPRYVSSWITYLWRYGWNHISEQLKTIEKLHHLTDHNKIYSILSNYNVAIPSLFGVEGELDPRWASPDELKYVFETAEKNFNTILGFHDNYLDYYPGTPRYDPALRAVDEDGNPMRGMPLPDYPGGSVADAYEYAVQVGLQRVRDTLSLYPIKEFHHIDAFHFLPSRDFSLESPSNREKNRRGVKLIIDEFNKHSINVTGEGLTAFYIGPGVGWFLRTPRVLEDNLPFSGAEVIPLLEFIYHGKTLYGLQDSRIYEGGLPPEQFDIYAFLEPLLLGASSGASVTWIPPDDLEIDKFYLIDLPWMALNQRFMEDYIVDGSYRKIIYDDDTFVEIDYDSKTYTVQVDGRVIGRNYTTFFPKNENTFLIYSREAKTISEALPEEWGKEMMLLKLTENGINPSVPFQFADGRITFQAEANTPYKLVRRAVDLIRPFDNQAVSACSYYNPPTFQWEKEGTFTKIEVQFSLSQNDFSTQPIIKVMGKPGVNTLLMRSFTWKKVLLFPGKEGGTIYWRVVGTTADKTEVESNVFSLRIEAPETVNLNAPQNTAILDPAIPPTFEFDTNCNTKFKLEISSLSDFSVSTKVKGFNFTVSNPNLVPSLQKALSAFQWTGVKKLVGTGIGYFRIKAWDALGRPTVSEIRSFSIQ
jgi:hypothetical protein